RIGVHPEVVRPRLGGDDGILDFARLIAPVGDEIPARKRFFLDLVIPPWMPLDVGFDRLFPFSPNDFSAKRMSAKQKHQTGSNRAKTRRAKQRESGHVHEISVGTDT